MNDDSQDSPVEQNAGRRASRATSTQSTKSQIRNDEARVQPTRWWMVSSAFPMLASTLGPVASAFSLCALVRPWRQYYPPGTNIDDALYLPDPTWLRVINGLQLLVALIANVFLYLNMTRRVRFTIAQPITIGGWYISVICLVVLLATASGPALKGKERPGGDFVWSQAFYYGIWAAILYFVDASLMAITYWATVSGRNRVDLNLTTNQRTLMLQTISFLLYLLIGALVFSAIEDWHYLDGVYWAEVTLLTVGFGDYTVDTNLGRGLLFPYALSGIISLGLVIASMRSLILERGKRYLDARVEERNRRKVIRKMASRGAVEIFKPLQRGPRTDDVVPGELQRRRAEFEIMRVIQQRATSRRRWMLLLESACSWLFLMFVGAVIFHKFEQPYQTWTYSDSLYFCYISLMTIGYGDVVPVSNGGKSFFVFWSILAVPTTTVLISTAGSTIISVIRKATIRLGNLTILPGKKSFAGEIKQVVSQLAYSLRMKGGGPAEAPDIDSEEQPNGNLAPVNSSTDSRTATRRSLSRLDHKLNKIPTGHRLQRVLISEIRTLLKDSREREARQYSFEEWAWYLGLMGEDERDPDGHLEVQTPPKHRRHDHHWNQQGEDERRKWSWVGGGNPLLSGKEESEWILEKMVDRLEESLGSF